MFLTAAELAEHQADAEERMLDTCRITRPAVLAPGEERPIDPDTLEYIDPPPVVVYEGKCRMPRKAPTSAQNAGETEGSWLVDEYPLAIPVTSSGYTTGEVLAVGQTVTYLTAADPDLAGRVFGITGVSHQTEATERRFRMKEVTGF